MREQVNFNLRDILLMFCNTIDQVNPILKYHHRRVAVICYNIGKTMGLSDLQLTRLVVAAALHDIGALTVEDRNALIIFDVEKPEQHTKMGKSMLQGFEPFKEVAVMISFHHVNYSKSKDNLLVPFESYIIHLADRIDILLSYKEESLNQKWEVYEKITSLNGSMFHPKVVDAFKLLSDKEYFWFDIDNMTMLEVLEKVNINSILYKKDKKSVEQLVYTLSKIIDYKSEFTAAHSKRVATISGLLAELMGYDEEHAWEVKIAGYMHDYGKIAVPSEILEKAGKLTIEEFNRMKIHPYFTCKILKDIDGMENIRRWASSHHEKLDNSGYPMKPSWTEMEEEIEIIIYADIFAALAETRPYRQAMNLDSIIKILDQEFRPVVGNKVFRILTEHKEMLYDSLWTDLVGATV